MSEETNLGFRLKLAELLTSVVDGSRPAAEALRITEQWSQVPWGIPPFETAYHALQHFEIDADIRARDSDYAASQVESIRLLVEELRRGV
jgi:hypothetical protein